MPGIADEEHFFKGEDGLVKVYELDRAAMIEFETKLWKNWQWNVTDRVNATHVAITQDGIKFVVDRHLKDCRSNCQEQGKVSKTVAFGKITDADIEEPAGKSGPCCCMVENTLTIIHVDTASSGGTYVNQHGQTVTQHELSIAGLVDPQGFKADVWSMIRGDGVGGVYASQKMERAGGGGGGGGGGEGKSVMERMDELTSMCDKGYVTEKEFEEKRKAILASA